MLAIFCVFVRADAVQADEGQPAPRFTAQTLDGKTFSSKSLGGSVTLLQFWATWCPHCREDQAAVDEIDRKFAGRGLVVLAIDEGEPAATVEKYLHEHPRSVRIALDEQKQIARRFGKHGFPYYVLIDRHGRIAGTQLGAAGEEALLALLKQADLAERPDAQARGRSSQQAADPAANQGANKKPAGDGKPAANQNQAGDANPEEPPKPSGMKVIEVPPDKNSGPAKPLPKTVFLLTSGERLETEHYAMDPQYLHVAVDGEERAIPMSAVNIQETEAANRARGVELKIPTTKSEVFVAF